MQDRLIKVLLTVVTLLLFTLLLRPQATTAQTQGAAPPVMAVEKGTIYILQNNQLSIYQSDPGINLGADLFALAADPKKRKEALQKTQVYHLTTQDLNKLERSDVKAGTDADSATPGAVKKTAP